MRIVTCPDFHISPHEIKHKWSMRDLVDYLYLTEAINKREEHQRQAEEREANKLRHRGPR